MCLWESYWLCIVNPLINVFILYLIRVHCFILVLYSMQLEWTKNFGFFNEKTVSLRKLVKYFLLLFWSYTQQCSGITHGFVLRDHFWQSMQKNHGEPYVELRIKLKLAACKANALTPILSLQPHKLSFRSQTQSLFLPMGPANILKEISDWYKRR